jgi:hypothetical protein
VIIQQRKQVTSSCNLHVPDFTVPNGSTVFRQVNLFRATRSAQDRNLSGRNSVLRDGTLDDIRQICLDLHGILCENFLSE